MPHRKVFMQDLSAAAQVNAVESAATSIASKGAMGGGTLYALYGWAISSGGVAIIGVLITVLGFIVTLYFQRRRDQREAADLEFRHQMELAQEARRVEIHQAQLAAIKYTQEPK